MSPKPNQFFSDEALVEGLRRQDSEIIQHLYDYTGPMVYNMVIKSGGGMDDARDIFQEGILAAYLNIRTGKYSISSQTRFSTYLVQICKFKWYDYKNSAYERLKGGEVSDLTYEDNSLLLPEKEDRIKVLTESFKLLGAQCQKILRLFYWEKWSLEEIGRSVNLEANSTKNQKYRCMEKLRALARDKK